MESGNCSENNGSTWSLIVSNESLVNNWIKPSVKVIVEPAKFTGVSEGKKRSRLSIPSGVKVPSNPLQTFFSAVEAFVMIWSDSSVDYTNESKATSCFEGVCNRWRPLAFPSSTCFD